MLIAKNSWLAPLGVGLSLFIPVRHWHVSWTCELKEGYQLPQLQVNQGQIINVSALNVLLLPMPEWSAYQASKSAFDQWFRSVSPELSAHGITTSTLYLPLVRTRMIAPTAMYQSAPAMRPEQVAALIGRLIIHKKTSFKPWWLYPVEVLSVLLQKPLALAIRGYYRRQARLKNSRD